MTASGCPRCAETLAWKDEGLACPRGHGLFTPSAMLQERADERRLRLPASHAASASCPACGTAMRTVTHLGLPDDAEPLALEACPACGGFWFDEGELARAEQAFPREAEKGRTRLVRDILASLMWGAGSL